jgi:glycosyltransferase involved in cell wall biosynthesis
MKIGINANYFQKPSTGIGVVTREFMRALKELPEGRSHEWIWYYEGEAPAGQWPDNWRFEKVSTWWTRDDIPHRYLWEHFSLPRAVRRDQCDVFFSLYQSATELPNTIRHIMLVHDLVPRRFPEYLANLRQRLYQRTIERAIRSADHIITPSEATKSDLTSLLAISADQITVVPLGVGDAFRALLAPAVRDQVLERYGLQPGYLYHGGGLELRKNTEVLLRAYAALMQTDAAALPILVVSGTVYAKTNPLATPVRSLISELGLGERVRLLGHVPDTDLPALYQGASIFIYPSRYEGFGLPVLEALASGTPVITTAAGSLAEVAVGAAEIIAPDDIDGLAQAIRRLSMDATARERLVAEGQERSLRYSWPRFAQSVVAALLQ